MRKAQESQHYWKEVAIGSVADVEVGGTPSTAVPSFWGGNIPWMSSGEVNQYRISNVQGRITESGLRSSNAKFINPPAVALALAGQGKTRGTVALTLISLCTNQSVALIKGRDELLDTVFLFHALDARYDELRTRSAGGGRAGLSKSIIEAIPIALPELIEQQKIVEILDAIDKAIALTDTHISKLKKAKAGLLHDLLTRGIDEHGELRDYTRNPELFKRSALRKIPKYWSVELVGEVFDMQLGKMLSKASKKGHNPYPYLANRHIQWERIDITNLEWMDFNSQEREKFVLLSGDLLVCEGGESGRTAIWKGELENCYFQKAIHRLRPKDYRIIPEYMLRFMRWAYDYALLTELTSKTSITHLTSEKFAILPISLPPTEEQQRIIQVFERHEERIINKETRLEKLKLLKKGLMSDLLTGRVRVKI
ncbi:MAG: restriction endonuclease subunit S [Nostoc sp.]|uniref:restriction endonuclease subunit S n=1 Tax=Nostoc sp. TaxID=1180 RepID=UPI002FF5F9D9